MKLVKKIVLMMIFMNKQKYFISLALTFLVCSCQTKINKDLKVTGLFSDHMVLQQQVNVWGEYTPKQKITLFASWGEKEEVSSDAQGKWTMQLSTPKAGGPYSIKITIEDSLLVINDLLIGEVWLAAGQSNMALPLRGWLPNNTVRNSNLEIAIANYPEIRMLNVAYNLSVVPVESVNEEWIVTFTETAADYSAIANFYAQKLYSELQVPIGIIQSSIGGTPAETWTSKEYLQIVQIAPYLYGAFDQKGESPKLRNAQRLALRRPKTGMAVTLDIGCLSSAHPSFKKEVGERIARLALSNDYGKELVASGPLYKTTTKSGNKLVVEFECFGSKLVVSEAGLGGFEIAGDDKVYMAANAKIVNNAIQVSSSLINMSVYVRYAWTDGCAASLFNQEGLLASTFTSEKW